MITDSSSGRSAAGRRVARLLARSGLPAAEAAVHGDGDPQREVASGERRDLLGAPSSRPRSPRVGRDRLPCASVTLT
jgi:hypothetical protein